MILFCTFLQYHLSTLVVSQATIAASENLSSRGAQRMANISASAMSAGARWFALNDSSGANFSRGSGLYCRWGPSGQFNPNDCHHYQMIRMFANKRILEKLVCQQASNSISAVQPPNTSILLPSSVDSTNTSRNVSPIASTTDQVSKENPVRLAHEVAAAGIIGAPGAAGIANYYNALQEAAAGGYAAVEDPGHEGVELQENRDREPETARIPTEGPTGYPSAVETSSPPLFPSSTQPPSASRASSNSSTSSTTAAPNVRRYSQDWIMPDNSIDVAAILDVAALLRSQFQSVGVAGLMSAAGSNPSNRSVPSNGSIPSIGSVLSSASKVSMSSEDFVALSGIGSSSSQPAAVPNATPAAEKLPSPNAKAASAWSAHESATNQTGWAIPAGTNPESCFTNVYGVDCCFDLLGTASYHCNGNPSGHQVSQGGAN